MKSSPRPKARSIQVSRAAGQGVQPRGRLAAHLSGRLWRLGMRLSGAGLLAATGAIHLDLYVTGYRSIPTIGWLFLLQVVAAFGLAAAVLATGGRLAAAAGAGFAVATLGGYLLSIWVGMFGFKEIRTTAGIVAGIIEVIGFAVLATLAAAGGGGQPAMSAAPGNGLLARLQAGLPGGGRAVAVISVAGLAALGISVGQAGGHAPAPTRSGTRTVLKTATIGGVTVLTNATGFTLYWFAPDSPTSSTCYGTCAGYWPPLIGAPSAGPGVTGKLGTIQRSDGTAQITYKGHPLYTYVGDTSPGQAFGNNLNLNGGLWHEMTAHG